MGYHENPPYFITAYEIAVKWGFRGTEKEWLNSLTAYAMAQEAGFSGTFKEWLAIISDPVPQLQIGEVVTLDGGSEATASITGDKRNPVLNLGIPRGAGMTDALPYVGGTMRGNILMDGYRVRSLPDPEENGDAANKKYVDKVAEKLSKFTNTDVDENGEEVDNLSGGGNSIVNVATPVNPTDAANKEYVDRNIGNVHQVPECREADNGKFLTVVNGVAAWTTVEVWAGGSY